MEEAKAAENGEKHKFTINESKVNVSNSSSFTESSNSSGSESDPIGLAD